MRTVEGTGRTAAHGSAAAILMVTVERRRLASVREQIAYDLEVSRAMVEPTYQHYCRSWAFIQPILVLQRLQGRALVWYMFLKCGVVDQDIQAP